MSALPWIKFFPADWLGENGLRLCSFAARGLWIDLLCLAWLAPERGVVDYSPSDLARLLGSTEDEIRSLVGELEGRMVLSRDEQGRIFSRRMVRDSAELAGLHNVRAQAGRQGGIASGTARNRSKTKQNAQKTQQSSSKPEATAKQIDVSDDGGDPALAERTARSREANAKQAPSNSEQNQMLEARCQMLDGEMQEGADAPPPAAPAVFHDGVMSEESKTSSAPKRRRRITVPIEPSPADVAALGELNSLIDWLHAHGIPKRLATWDSLDREKRRAIVSARLKVDSLRSVAELCAEARRIVQEADPAELYWLSDLKVLLRVDGRIDHWARLKAGAYRRNESAVPPQRVAVDHGAPAPSGLPAEVLALRVQRVRKAASP